MVSLCFCRRFLIQLKQSFKKNLQTRLHCSSLESITQFVETAWYHIHQICFKFRFFVSSNLLENILIYIGAIHWQLYNDFVSYCVLTSTFSWAQSYVLVAPSINLNQSKSFIACKFKRISVTRYNSAQFHDSFFPLEFPYFFNTSSTFSGASTLENRGLSHKGSFWYHFSA